MNYEENNIDWKIGDIVIHDADAKRENCLAKIVEKKETKQGMRYRMLYLDKKKNYQQWWNNKECLHDPKRFNINPKNQKQDKEDKEVENGKSINKNVR